MSLPRLEPKRLQTQELWLLHINVLELRLKTPINSSAILFCILRRDSQGLSMPFHPIKLPELIRFPSPWVKMVCHTLFSLRCGNPCFPIAWKLSEIIPLLKEEKCECVALKGCCSLIEIFSVLSNQRHVKRDFQRLLLIFWTRYILKQIPTIFHSSLLAK